jgi:hypothetical protein
MFGRKYNPEEIAERLRRLLLPSGGMELAAFLQAVCPDEAERERMILNTNLFPIAASYGIVNARTKPKFRDALFQAHELYLNRFREQDKLVSLGDYIIWRVERDWVERDLRERFCQLITPSSFNSHKIPFGMLLRIATDFRKATFRTDLQIGMAAGGGDQKREVILIFAALGTTFTRQVLKIDPTDPGLSSDEINRFQLGLGYASALLGHGFFNLTELFKEMGA